MAPHDESIPDLIRGTIRDGIGLLRDEVVLLRAELRDEYQRIRGGLVTAVAAVVLGVFALFMLLSTIAWGVAYVFEWPAWAGFATVALPLTMITVVVAMKSRTMMSNGRFMPKTVDTLKENAEWIRARTQS